MSNSKQSAVEILAARLAELEAKRKLQTKDESEQPVTKSHLTPERRQDRNFFEVDIFDAPFKEDLASMEHPLFALKAGDTRVREYEHNGNTITVLPNIAGCATIHDKDVWIYCISVLVAAKNRGEPINRKIRFTAYDFLATTNRRTGGTEYRLLKQTFDRLAGTRIVTNIKTGKIQERRNFGLLDEVRIIYEDETNEKSPMIAIEVTLPEWLFRSIEFGEIKTISPDYFRIRKPIDRRIYELCAKHCGKQHEWSISLELLHKKTGSSSPLRNFRIAVRSLVESNELPDYSLKYDEKRDMLKVTNRNIKSLLSKLKMKNKKA